MNPVTTDHSQVAFLYFTAIRRPSLKASVLLLCILLDRRDRSHPGTKTSETSRLKTVKAPTPAPWLVK
jgi:hypothetical protein